MPVTQNTHVLTDACIRRSLHEQVVSERVDKPRNIEFKGLTDLVTDTDKASEEAVLAVRS